MGPPGKIGPTTEKHYIEGSLQRVLKSLVDDKLPQPTNKYEGAFTHYSEMPFFLISKEFLIFTNPNCQ